MNLTILPSTTACSSASSFCHLPRLAKTLPLCVARFRMGLPSADTKSGSS
jgi:hypothetical protein